ncbi:MAG: hypothetical protein ALECFALPRED_009791 [Alectoria fallacina]|uniref:Uncharacterized protein n=1 Tax=Alectoria fallacina TaxID=1903189 RepID=A0A8H3PJQ6_9LECA|nr:MAG: hypothetical protein ALECFALPRED_009791 [Alectoria fallacina]
MLTSFFNAAKIRPVDTNKPVPNASFVTHAFKTLLSYGDSTWDKLDGFDITRRHGRHLQTFIEDAIKADRLIKGSWRKRTWDIVVAKCLSVVPVASLGCRSGNVARSNGDVGFEYMQWRHIDLFYEGEPTYLNLRATVTLKFQKGFKDTRNQEFLRYSRPLEDLSSQYFCPIAWIMVHALHDGSVSGSTLNEVLDDATTTQGLRVKQKSPDLPVLSAFAHEVRQSIGHKPSSIVKGTTEDHVGDSSREDKFKRHRREPKFSYVSAHDVVKAPITKTEIDTWKKNNGDLIQENDYYTKIETERIRRAIRRDRGDHYLKTAPFETSLTGILLLSLKVGKIVQLSNEIQSTACGAASLTNVESHNKEAQFDDFNYSLIDPSLLDEDSL